MNLRHYTILHSKLYTSIVGEERCYNGKEVCLHDKKGSIPWLSGERACDWNHDIRKKH